MKSKKKVFKVNKNKTKQVEKVSFTFKLPGNDFFLVTSFVLLFTLLFFYPGSGAYFNLFAYNNSLSSQEKTKEINKQITVPSVIDVNLPLLTTATGVYAIDLGSATPLYAKNQHIKLYPASTTKIVTALTAIRFFKLDQALIVKRTIEDGQVVGLRKGEKFTFENLLYGLLVHSGNDAAYTIADNYPGGYGEFVEKMNEVAQEIRMTNSRFTNPAGLDSSGQYTTAFDLTLAARKLLESKELSKIVSTKSITISDMGFNHFYQLNNVNKLLGEIPGLGGLKTGFTENAKENLVSFYSRFGRKYVIVILKSDDRFEDTKSLINWLNNNVRYSKYII